MTIVFIFAVTLLVAVLLSEYASRSVLSTAVLFLVVGFVAGQGVFGWIRVAAEGPVVERFVELALFSVLFTDGMRLRMQDLRSAWALPGRALLLGMPLVVAGTALAGVALAGLSWPEALLVGAVLAPTDPVFAAALVGHEGVSRRMRHLLNVESGVNDGLALPLVLALLATVGRGEFRPLELGIEVVSGLALGVVLPVVAVWLERRRLFAAAGPIYEPLLAFSIALLLYAVAGILHANPFLAAFAGGITLATVSERARDQFHAFGDLLAELLKLAALLVFGSLIAPSYFRELSVLEYVFVFLVLVAVRPLALQLSLVGSTLEWRERMVVSWFGPKGFASVLFGLLILHLGGARMEHLFHLVALVVAASIIAHSSTDVIVVDWLRRTELVAEGHGVAGEETRAPVWRRGRGVARDQRP